MQQQLSTRDVSMLRSQLQQSLADALAALLLADGDMEGAHVQVACCAESGGPAKMWEEVFGPWQVSLAAASRVHHEQQFCLCNRLRRARVICLPARNMLFRANSSRLQLLCAAAVPAQSTALLGSSIAAAVAAGSPLSGSQQGSASAAYGHANQDAQEVEELLWRLNSAGIDRCRVSIAHQ
jgi:hypothetical protein